MPPRLDWRRLMARSEVGRGNSADTREQLSDELLREQREWLRVTLSSIGDAVVTTNTDGNVTFLNPVAESLTGWTQEEAAGIPLERIFKIVNEETRRTVENPATRALRDGLIVGLANHTLLVDKNGTERPIDDSAAPIRDAKGEVAGVVLVFRDVTERRLQDRKIQDALAYAQSIVATVREPMVVLHDDLRVKTANRSFYQTFHVSPDETEGHLIHELGNRQWDIPKLRSMLESIRSNARPFEDFEVEHDFPAIGPRSMLLNARRVRESDGVSELILLAIEDVTDRRTAEADLRDSELRYRRLFETARDGILILDAATGKITDTNPFITEVLGFTKDELLDKELWEIGLFEDKGASQRAFRQLQERGHIRYDDLPLENRSGRRVEVEFVSNVYEVDHRSVIQCNIRDISERRQLERARVQTEAMADLHRRKDEFLAMLSHELRSPLAPIMNAVHLLGLERPSETALQKQARSIIERQVGQLRVLVDDLLEISRITTGRIRLHEEDVDMRIIVKVALETVEPLATQRKQEIVVSLPQEPVWLHGDSYRLEQVVVNLLNNAAKYSDEGGRIGLGLQQEEQDVVLRVTDSGVGIDPELLPRIFDLFTQAERSLDRSQGGLGVGLTVAQKLVEMHGGRVEVASVLGKGSEFTVHLPRLRHGPESQPKTEARHPQLRSFRVLVVDDNADHADSTALLLQRMGHDVRVVYSSPAALETAADFLPEVILMDIGLPLMDGYEVARRLRRHDRLKGVWMIAVSGYGQDSDRERSHAAGFNLHLVKPISPRELQEACAAAAAKSS